MKGFAKVVSWLLGCLGVVMVGAAILVVPANAFADAGSDCISAKAALNNNLAVCDADRSCNSIVARPCFV
jgi:hypothetical protein